MAYRRRRRIASVAGGECNEISRQARDTNARHGLDTRARRHALAEEAQLFRCLLLPRDIQIGAHADTGEEGIEGGIRWEEGTEAFGDIAQALQEVAGVLVVIPLINVPQFAILPLIELQAAARALHRLLRQAVDHLAQTWKLVERLVV